MADWTDEYADADDRNEKYRLLREEVARLRGRADGTDFYDEAGVAETVRRLNGEVDGELLAFVANDFGLPVGYRPEGTGVEMQAAVRRAVLENKYDANPDLDELRRRLLDAHPGVHKAIVAVCEAGSIRYHLPEGSGDATNFLTVREMVGLVDYTTNGPNDGMRRTY